MNNLAIRLQKAFFKVPYSRHKRSQCADRALADAVAWLRAEGLGETFEKCSLHVYLPGDVYSWTEFEFFFDIASTEDIQRLTEAGMQEALKSRLTGSLRAHLPALADPVVVVWFR